MPLTRSKNLQMVKIVGITIVVCLILTYAIWRSLNYARGPHIDIFEPANGSLIENSIVEIRGQVTRANNVSLNGKDLTIDEQGHFNETIIVFPGINQITLSARDQFGRSTSQQLQLVGKSLK